MATSVFMVSDHENTGSFNECEETRTENAKQSGRRKSKLNELSTQKKKQPQRGMGVAQLERLRLQERWKKMTEINPLPLHSLGLHHPQILPSSLADPTPTGVPVQFAKFSAYGAMNGVGQLGPNQASLFQKLGNGGFHGLAGSSGVTDQFLVDPYGMGARNPSFRVENAIETSKELSSMPNMRCYSEQCGVCHKKKRINGENLRCSGVKDMYTDISSINGCSSLGFNLGNNQNIDGQNQVLSARAPSRAGYAGHNVDQEVEVVAVHRNGSVFMEYEFFPGKGGRSTSPKELKLGLEASVAAVGTGEASRVTTTTPTGVDASYSVDLSLKLSY